MLFDVLPVLLIFIAVVIIVAIVLRRLPDIATINIETIAEAQTAATKRQLLVQRLERKIGAVVQRAWQGTSNGRQIVYDNARALYQQLLEWEKRSRKSEPEGAPLGDKSSDELLQEAERVRESGKKDGVEELYLEAIRIDHRNARAYYGLGLLYWAEEQYAEARQALEYAVRLDHENPLPLVALARLAVDDGRAVDAMNTFEKAIALDPDNVEYRIGLGDAAMLKDAAAAVGAFEAAVVLEPMNPRCLDRLLEACILVGNKRLAVGTLKRLMEVNPENKKLADFRERVAELPARPRRVQKVPPT